MQLKTAISFAAIRDQVFKAFPAIANLTEKSDDGKVVIHIEATAQNGFDPGGTPWKNPLTKPTLNGARRGAKRNTASHVSGNRTAADKLLPVPTR